MLSLILICFKSYRKQGVFILIILLVTTILGQGIIKNIVGRPRPFYKGFESVIAHATGGYSFPSGHTAASFAAAYAFTKTNKKLGWFCYPLAALTAYSRMYLMVHYFTDIIGGVILGTACSFIICYIADKKFNIFGNG